MMKEENEDQERRLNNLFTKAKEEQPIVEWDDVKKLVYAQSTAMVGQSILSRYKYWGMGVLSVFIVAVIFFGYNQNLKTGKEQQPAVATIVQHVEELQDEPQTNAVTKTIVESNPNTVERNILHELPINPNKVASAQEVSETKSSKQDDYFHGDAKINFENEGANVNMIVGDELKRLEINGTLINENEYPKYDALIQKGKALKTEADKSLYVKTDAKRNQQQKNREVMNELIKQLKSDKIIAETDHFEFRITGSKLYINEIEQSKTLFIRYKNLYETVSGNRLNAKSNLRIKH